MKPILKLVTRKPILPSDEELEANNRSRSAKLRVAEKINDKGGVTKWQFRVRQQSYIQQPAMPEQPQHAIVPKQAEKS